MIDVALASDGASLDLSPDDRLLRNALGERGLTTAVLPWTHEAYEWRQVRCCLPRGGRDPLLDVAATEDGGSARSSGEDAQTARDHDHWLGRVQEQSAFVNSLRAMRWNLHARCLVDLTSRGLAVVPTSCFSQGAEVDLAALLEERQAERVVLAPALRRAVSPRAFPRSRIKTAQRHLDQLLAKGDAAVVPDPPRSAVRRSLVYIDGGYSHAVEWQGRDPSTLQAALPREDEVRLAQDALAAVPGEATYARIDLTRDANGEPVLWGLDLVDGPLFFAWSEDAADRLAASLFARLARGA